MKSIYFCMVAFLLLATPAALAEDSDTETFDHPTYSKVVLWAVGFEREDQTKIETSVVKGFAKKDVIAIPMVELATEDRPYSRQELAQLVAKSGAGAVFELVDAGEKGMKAHRSNQTESIIKSGSTGSNSSLGGGGSPQMMGAGGDNMRYRPTHWFSAYITDVATGKEVWTDQIKATAYEGSELRVFAGKAFRRAAKITIKDGYFVAAAPDSAAE